MPSLKKTSSLFVLSVLLCSALLVAPIAARASGTIVQQAAGGCSECDGISSTVAFGNQVSSGDLIVVGVSTFFDFAASGPYTVNVTDSLGSDFVSAVNDCNSTGYANCASIFYATALSSGEDSVNVTVNDESAPISLDIFVYELTGVTTTGFAVGTGEGGSEDVPEGSPDSVNTTQTSFTSEGFLLGVVNLCTEVCSMSNTDFTPGAGFAATPPTSGSDQGFAQYSTGGVSSPSDFPGALSQDQLYWVEVSLALNSASGSPSGGAQVVQQNSLSTANVVDASLSFIAPVTEGDVVVVAFDVTSTANNVVTSVTDSLGSSYSAPSDSPSCWAPVEGCAYIYYASLNSGGSDSITIHFTGSEYVDIFLFEVSGITTSGVTSGAGESTDGNSASVSTTSTSFGQEGFLVATAQTYGSHTFSAGAGFSASAKPSGDLYSLTEYSTSGVSSPTVFPMTLNSTDQWDEVGVAFPLSVGPAPTPVHLPPVIPQTVTFSFNLPGAPTLTGHLVSLYGVGILYNVPGFNSTTDVFPYSISVCSETSSNLIQVTGFFSTGPGNNSTELFVSNWSTFTTSGQGWPTEPACTT